MHKHCKYCKNPVTLNNFAGKKKPDERKRAKKILLRNLLAPLIASHQNMVRKLFWTPINSFFAEFRSKLIWHWSLCCRFLANWRRSLHTWRLIGIYAKSSTYWIRLMCPWELKQAQRLVEKASWLSHRLYEWNLRNVVWRKLCMFQSWNIICFQCQLWKKRAVRLNLKIVLV